MLLPVVLSSDNSEDFGYLYLILGYITIVDLPIAFICWLGNLTLILSWILYRFRISQFLNVLSFLQMAIFGIDYLFQLELIKIINYESQLFGYFFWLSSSIAMLLYHFYPLLIKHTESQI